MRVSRRARVFLLCCGVAAAAPQADDALNRGLVLAGRGALDEAESVFKEGRTRFPADERFSLELAGVAYRRRENRLAKRYLHEALRFKPADSYGCDFLATLYLLEKNLPAALKYWNRIEKPVIQKVQFAGAPEIDPVLWQRSLGVSAGQVFTLQRLRETQSSFDRLEVLASYGFDLTPRQDERFDLTFHASPGAGPLGGWVSLMIPVLRGLPYQTLYLDRTNIGQRAINVASIWRWDAEKRRLAASVSSPFQLNPRHRYRLTFDARDENWDLSTADAESRPAPARLRLRKAEFGADFEFGLTGRLAWTTGLRVDGRSFGAASGALFPGDALFKDSWSVEQINKLDYLLWTWPERRIRADASAQLRTGRIFSGGPHRFAILEGDLNGRWTPPASGDNLVVRTRARAARTFGTAPFDELFMLGVERDNDLWLRGHAGTRDGMKGAAPLGSAFVLLQTDLDRMLFRLPLLRVSAGPFLDTGRIEKAGGYFGSSGWMTDTGMQAKLSTALGVTWSFVYGRDLRNGGHVFYTSVTRGAIRAADLE